jgi:hypothetical protein
MAFVYIGNFAVYLINLKGYRVVTAQAKQYGNIGTVARPVLASEPYSNIFTCTTSGNTSFCLSNSTNCCAARHGPSVCELDGPMPILNISNTEICSRCCMPKINE